MNKKEVRAKVTEMLSAGEKKQVVFAALSGKGVKDRVLAYFIASHIDPRRCAENRTHRRIVIAIAYFQVVAAILTGLYIAVDQSVTVGLLVGALALLFAVLFVWGFSKNKAGAYNAFLFLSLSQFPRQFRGFSEDPVMTSAGLAIGIGLIAYVCFVRQRLFPDLAFMGAMKVRGRYVFSD
jgi:hypothetical protein